MQIKNNTISHNLKGDIFIYGLIDPITREIRYIGKTSCGLKRIKNHFSDYKRKHRQHYPIYRWMRKLMNNYNLLPDYVIIEYAQTDKDVLKLEEEIIFLYKQRCTQLLNCTDGGDGSKGYVPSEETREKLRNAWTDEMKKQKSEFIKQLHAKPEVKQKMREFGKRNMIKRDIRGERNPQYGKTGALNPQSKPVECYDLNGNYLKTYPSARDAANDLGIKTFNHISSVIYGKRHHCGGYKWKLVTTNDKEP